MPADLRTLFELEPRPDAYKLESFISDRLFEAGVWNANNCPDGIVHIRVLEADFDRLRLCGRLFEINGELHPFSLEIERPPSSTAVTWSLYLDAVATTPRRARDAIDLVDRASEIEWRVTLSGKAEVRDGTLLPLP